jgi:hypothetical protein
MYKSHQVDKFQTRDLMLDFFRRRFFYVMVEVLTVCNGKRERERKREILIIIKNDFQSAIQNGFICHDLWLVEGQRER